MVAKALSPGEIAAWDESKPGPSVFASGGLVVRASAQKEGADRVPALTVTAPTGQSITVKGVVGFEKAAMTFGVGRIDTDSPIDQVLMMSYSGGAHCCTAFKLIDFLDGAWRVVDLGSWDGEGLNAFPKDEDGDGRPDLVFQDNRFDYAFASHADSWSPPLIQNVIHGRVIDVSADRRFRRLNAAMLSQTQPECAKGNNGACAAYVAVAARLGEAAPAWTFMLAHYNRSDDWSLPTGCKTALSAARTCPTGEEIKYATYPDALRAFLINAGYLTPGALTDLRALRRR